MDLRILFLVMLGLSALLFFLRKGAVLTIGDIFQIAIDFLLVLAVAGTVGTFYFLITRQDPIPLLRATAYQLSFQQLVSFEAAIPARLENNLEVQEINRVDTDGDGFKEWIVFYKFDLHDAVSPVKGAVYDSDRGNPPVLFPYALRPPDRDYLSEGGVKLELAQVTANINNANGQDLEELLIWGGNTTLTIFRFDQNSEMWDFPRDAPPRYTPIGFFRGSGGVSFDVDTKLVTVQDRDGFERSQLAVRSIYTLNPATNTYLDSFDSTKLAAPIVSTIDFWQGPPADILDTAFPEKVVLAFYTSTCGGGNETLCRNDQINWSPQSFLAPGSEAMSEFENNNPGYFGLPSFTSVNEISVVGLRYYPSLETDPDLLVTGGGRDVVTGEEGQLNVVDIALVANGGPLQTLRFTMGNVEGQWKIFRRVAVEDQIIEVPVEIITPPQ